jgi:hypothetical protein
MIEERAEAWARLHRENFPLALTPPKRSQSIDAPLMQGLCGELDQPNLFAVGAASPRIGTCVYRKLRIRRT